MATQKAKDLQAQLDKEVEEYNTWRSSLVEEDGIRRGRISILQEQLGVGNEADAGNAGEVIDVKAKPGPKTK